MANCVTCDANCERAGQHHVKTDCVSYVPKDYSKSRTNYDRIVSKSPEELADYLVRIEAKTHWRAVGIYPSKDEITTAMQECLDWLKQETDDDKQ